MILDNLVNGETQLSKSERKIASIVLSNPSRVINQSISALSSEADVSLPTVNRFCKKLGFDGYPSFKIQIAQELSTSNRMLIDRFNVDKDTPDLVKRVMSDIQSTVVSVGQNLNPNSIDKATAMLASAKSITCLSSNPKPIKDYSRNIIFEQNTCFVMSMHSFSSCD